MDAQNDNAPGFVGNSGTLGRLEAAVGALEDLVIAISMGWELDCFVSNAKDILVQELNHEAA